MTTHIGIALMGLQPGTDFEAMTTLGLRYFETIQFNPTPAPTAPPVTETGGNRGLPRYSFDMRRLKKQDEEEDEQHPSVNLSLSFKHFRWQQSYPHTVSTSSLHGAFIGLSKQKQIDIEFQKIGTPIVTFKAKDVM